MINTTEIRSLVDKLFSLQWCRENIVVPLGTDQSSNSNQQADDRHWRFSYLGIW